MLDKVTDAVKREIVGQVILNGVSVSRGADAAVLDSTWSPSKQNMEDITEQLTLAS